MDLVQLALIRDRNRENKIDRISIRVQRTAQTIRAEQSKAVDVGLDERGLHNEAMTGTHGA